jgi:hypothetical protein
VTPRRLQKFLLTPGQHSAWTNVQSGASIASGTVAADANGLLTVSNFTITTSGNRLIITIDIPDIPQVGIVSSSHPEGVATPNRSVSFTWSVLNGVTADGFSWVLDQASGTVPDTTSEGTGTSLTTNNLDNGTYYLHVRGHGADGWGAADHYAVVVDEFEGHWREAPPLPAPAGRVVYVGTASALQTALNTAQTGDTIMISNGTYTVTRRYIRGKDITVRGITSDPTKVVLQSKTWNDSSAFDDYDDVLRLQSCTNVTIAHLTIGECHSYGIKMEHDVGAIRDLRIYNCRFVNNGTRGIKGVFASGRKVQGGRVEYCSFQNYKAPPATWNDSGNYITSVDCMQLADWTFADSYFRNIKGRSGGGRGAVFVWNACTNIVVERCAFVGCDRSIAYGNPSTPTGGDPAVPHVASGIIRNNLITIGADSGIELSSVAGVKLLHNTIWTGDPVNGMAVNCPAYGVGVNGELRNNIIRGKLGGSYGGLTQSGNVMGSTVQSSWFIDYAAADLRLASNVAAVTDEVTVHADCPTDWDGHFRPTGAGLADVGADEYGVVYFDTAPPVVSGVSCGATTNSIAVSWSTDEAANSIVRYSTTNNWVTASVTQKAESVMSHALTILKLPSNTFYYVWIGAVDAAGNSRALGAPDGGAATVGGGAGGQTVTLRQGVNSYSGCIDSEIKNTSPDSNYGSGTTAQVGGPDAIHPEMNEWRFLLDFDLAGQVPAGVTVTSATLSVLSHGAYNNVVGHNVGVHALTRSFNESQVTWNSAASGQAWTTVGGDYGAALGVFNVPGNTGWLNYDVRTTVQDWVNTPANRHGFILVHQDDWKYLYVYTSENGTATNRPTLVIGYSSPPPVVRITSTTHADGALGYASTVATMQWSVVNGMTADEYSRVFDRQPATVPDTVSEGTGVSWTTNNLTSGVWYLHVRAHSADGWGPAAHFAVNVGADPDTDGDGMSDVHEAIAGTSPVNAADVLGFVSISLLTGGNLRLEWPGKGQHTYFLQHTPSLFRSFTNIAGAQLTPIGDGAAIFTCIPAGNTGFYRIAVE